MSQKNKTSFLTTYKPVRPVLEEAERVKVESSAALEGKNNLTRLNGNVIIYTSFPASRFYQHFLGLDQTLNPLTGTGVHK